MFIIKQKHAILKKGTNSNNSPLHLPAWMLKVNKL